jgi:hypothetical protein
MNELLTGVFAGHDETIETFDPAKEIGAVLDYPRMPPEILRWERMGVESEMCYAMLENAHVKGWIYGAMMSAVDAEMCFRGAPWKNPWDVAAPLPADPDARGKTLHSWATVMLAEGIEQERARCEVAALMAAGVISRASEGKR